MPRALIALASAVLLLVAAVAPPLAAADDGAGVPGEGKLESAGSRPIWLRHMHATPCSVTIGSPLTKSPGTSPRPRHPPSLYHSRWLIYIVIQTPPTHTHRPRPPAAAVSPARRHTTGARMSRQQAAPPLALASALLLLLAAAAAVAPLGVAADGGLVQGGGEVARSAANTLAVGADPDPSSADGIPADRAPDAHG
uniref:Uncharacterized protein n=1 Tax=Oryza meridionalis TaxID=40149 RepID=A0A0E0ET61_9ORYZ